MSNEVFYESRKIVGIDIVIAFLLAFFVAGPLSLKVALTKVNPKEDKPYIVNLVMTCSTIIFMCPMMSFAATVMFDGFTSEFIANWMEKIAINFPFAFFVEIFLVQPVTRKIFSLVFKNKNIMNSDEEEYIESDGVVSSDN